MKIFASLRARSLHFPWLYSPSNRRIAVTLIRGIERIPSLLKGWQRIVTLVMASAIMQTGYAQTLHFKSGFEPGTAFPAGVLDLTGTDNSVPSGLPRDWVADLDNDARLGNFSFQTHLGTNGVNVTIVDDPTGSNRGKVLRYWLQTPNSDKGRIQANVFGSAANFNEVTSVIKMYLHPDLYTLTNKPEHIYWFTLQELFTNPIFDGRVTNFRISIGVGKSAGAGQKLYWYAQSDEAGNTAQSQPSWKWSTNTSNTAIWASDSIGKWITLVMYYKKGDASTGRLKLKMIQADGTQQELINVTGWTYHPTESHQNVGLTHHNPFKMYAGPPIFDWVRTHSQGGNGAAIIYWDDWEYYEGDAYTNLMTAPFNLTATATSSTQVNLAWSNVPNETGFRIERKTGSGAYSQLAPPNKAANILTHNDTSVTPSTTYTYRVRAEKVGSVSDWSPERTVTTPAGGTPTLADFNALTISASSGDGTSAPTDAGASEGDYLRYNANGTSDFVTFDVVVPNTATYGITLRLVRGTDAGMYQLAVDGVNQGAVTDFYGTSGTNFVNVNLGSKALTSGTHQFRFTCTSKNASSTGYRARFDTLTLTP